MRGCPPVRLSLRRSRYEFILLVGLHMAAMPAPWLAALPAWLKVVIDLALLGSAVFYLRRWRAMPYEGLRLLPDGSWALAKGSEEIDAEQMPGGYLSPYLIVLPLRPAGQRTVRLVLWPDSAPADDIRRMRVWLKWGVRPGVGGAQDAQVDLGV